MTASPRNTAQPRFPRRSLEELLNDARRNEARAQARFEKKTAAVQKYEGLKRLRERKLDTRRKIIAGALALEHAKLDPEFGKALWAVLDSYVTKAPERLLFGLPALPASHQNPPERSPTSG